MSGRRHGDHSGRIGILTIRTSTFCFWPHSTAHVIIPAMKRLLGKLDAVLRRGFNTNVTAGGLLLLSPLPVMIGLTIKLNECDQSELEEGEIGGNYPPSPPACGAFLLILVTPKLNGRGPVFYRAQRASSNGQSFQLFNFRPIFSMVQSGLA